MNPTQTNYGKIATTPEEMAANRASLVAGSGGTLQDVGGNVVPLTNASTPAPITSSSLQSSTPTPLPQQPYTPTTTSLGVANNTTMGQVATDASYTPPATTPQNSLKDSLASLTTDITGNQTQINNLNNDAELAAKKQKAVAISTEVDQLDKSYQDEIKNIKQTFQGSPQGLQDSLNQAQDRYQNNRANLALVYKVASSDYQGAQEIADRKIASLKDTNAQKIQLYQLNADAIRNDLTDSEKTILQANITKKLNDAKAVTDAYSTAVQNAVQNKAPASVLSALDEAARNPNASVASIYAAAGNYGIENKFTSVTNTLTGEQTPFNTTTGQYGARSGNGIATPVNSQPIVTGGVTAHPPTGNPITDQAQQLVDGNAVPVVSGKLTPRDLAIQQQANRLSLAQTGKPYSAIDAAAAYKFRTSKQYTQFIANAPVAISTINTIVNDIHQLNDSGFSLNGIDAYNMAKLTAIQFNPFADPTQRAIAKELTQTLGSISADDIGLLLGSGSGSDYKTKLGGAIFDVSGNLQSTDRISQTIKDRIQAKLNDYYKIAGVTDPSIYATRDTQAITGSSPSGTSTPGAVGTTITSSQARSQYGY